MGEGTAYWVFESDVYQTDDLDLTSEEIRALLVEERLRQDRIVERAMNVVNATTSPMARRTSIPEDVKSFVWKRDEGHCVTCGLQENLEFDHVIPVSKGGSNTARNLQLRCESCNRRKGADIA